MTEDQIMETAKEAGFHYPHNDCLLILFARLIEQKSKREWIGIDHIKIGQLWSEHKEVYSFAMAVEQYLRESNQ